MNEMISTVDEYTKLIDWQKVLIVMIFTECNFFYSFFIFALRTLHVFVHPQVGISNYHCQIYSQVVHQAESQWGVGFT
jgi:hypothetical protein